MMDKLLNSRVEHAHTVRAGYWLAVVLAGAWCGPTSIEAQVSASAYRVLGQSDLSRNGLNRVQGNEFASPNGLALDIRGGLSRIYIADTGNHRILAWADAQSYDIGEVPALVMGQPSSDRNAPGRTGGLVLPTAIGVSPLTGDVYVADTGNHRVLRYPDPFKDPARVAPDAVYGQPDMTGTAANGSGNPASSLRNPTGVAIDAAGNLWIADTGNNRVLRYPAATLGSSSPQADIVLGQRDFLQSGRNRSGPTVSSSGFDTPAGLAFDSRGNLFVSDAANSRVLRFTPPFTPDSAASVIVSMPAGRNTIPGGITVSDGQLYVALPRENRVLVFQDISAAAVPASVFGQADLAGREANAGVQPRAAAHTLSEPADVKLDSQGNVYIADTANHRVLRFRAGSRSADRVWGQLDFAANGVNQVKASGMNRPFKVVVDYSGEPFALYVSDTDNHRVLFWKNAARYRSGDPADGVIGQPSLVSGVRNFEARTPTANTLHLPRGIALDSFGNLYVADSGNNRVLRFPRPVDGVRPADLVLGQPDFTTGGVNAPGPASLRNPVGVAIGPDGGIFVSDTGNNRVVEFPAGASLTAAAIRVYGQPHLSTAAGSASISSQTLTAPAGITVDAGFNLYVADSGANRIVMFANTRDAGPASNTAVLVLGSDSFDRAGAGGGRTRLKGPIDVALDSAGRLYVSDLQNNRVLVFPSLIFLPITDGSATAVIGQPDFNSNAANWNSREGLATAEGVFEPAGIFVDRRDTVYVADSGNHRILHFLRDSRIYHDAHRQASALPRGGLVTIEGDGLADSTSNNSAPLSQTLADREVVIEDSIPAPLISVSPSTIALQLPSTAPTGLTRLAVRVSGTAELIAGGVAAVSTYAPGLYAGVRNADGSVNADNNAALRGTVIRLTGTGQGPVRPTLADGEAAPDGAAVSVAVPVSDSNACLTRQPSVCVSIGNTFGEIRFSGLAADRVGVWQLDVRIPENAPTGIVPVRAVINAVPSNIVNVAIR